MSFSFSVPVGPAAEFGDRADKAKADMQTASENNDYQLTQLASDTAEAAIKASVALVDSLGVGNDGTASGTISGHHADNGVSASSASVSVTFTPAPAAPAI